MDFNRGNAFRFHGFDGVDALVLFALAALLAALHHLFPFDLGSELKGLAIGLSVIGSLYLRELKYPKAVQMRVDANRKSLLGVLAGFLACLGFIASLLGFSRLIEAKSLQPMTFSEEHLQREVARQMEMQELQEEMAVLASAQKLEPGEQLPAETEKLDWEEVKKGVQEDVAAKQEQIKSDVLAALQAEMMQDHQSRIEVRMNWAETLIPIGLLLLIGAAFIQKIPGLLRG